ncbi:PAS domain S-box protein [Methanobacterium sp.]|uniref:PAS domain S-box protein n=1 Tax=Methanobacterium sp. TaxID=2164 RepID=UPI0025FA75C5|nr:PAS domain S-box protein [Methanobacterium sp.]MBI5460502.1 PAS domain S-box protein [Methanobacterium sp.]
MVDVKILIVEDESIEAMDIKRALESFGYSVPYIASSGEEAVEKAFNIMPDLILMDIVLKGEKNGIDAASKIKELDIPVVFLTAHSKESVVKQAMLTDAYGYLLKPFNKTELKFTVELALYKKKMEKELKQSEKRFKTLYNEAPLPYHSLDVDGYFLEVNQSWLDTLGYNMDEVIGKHFSDFLAPDYVDHFKQNFSRFKAAGEIHGVEFQMKRKDGSSIPVSFEGKIGYDVQGNFKQTHCIFQDITERKKTEKALKESELSYRFLTEQMNDIVWTLNMELQTTYVSPSIKRVLGFTPEERMKQQVNEQVTPKSMFQIQEILKNELMLEKQGLPGTDRTINIELEYYHKDGSTRWLENVISGIRDDEGKLYGFHGVSRDITMRKKNEMDFRKLYNRSEEALSLSKMAYWEYDIPSNTFTFNERFYKLHGIDLDDIGDYKMGADLFAQNFVHPDFHEQLTDAFQQAITSSDPFFQIKVEGKLIRSNGETFWVRTWFRAKKDEKGHTRKLYGVNQDITDIKMIEEALEESEERYALTISAVNDGLWDWNVLTGKAYFSPIYYQMLGYHYKEFPGSYESFKSLVHPDDIGQVEQKIQDHIDKGEGYSLEFRMKTKDGKWCWILTRGKVVEYDKEGKPKRMVGTHTDITDLKLAEKTLENSEKRFRMLFEQNNAVMLLIDPKTGKIVDANHAASKFYGYHLSTLRSMNLDQINQLPSEEIRKARESVIKGGEYFIFPHKLAGGEIRTVEVFSSPMQYGDKIMLFSIINDITEQKKAEDALRKREETFSSLIYNSTDLIRILDEEGQIIFDSPSSERILGYSEGYFIGKNPMDFIHPDDQERVAHDLEEVFQKRNPGIPTEFRILKADGEYLPVESVSKNMMNVPGIDGVVVTTHPIKERKEMEEALLDSEEKYRVLFESDPNYMVLVGLDGVILDVNDATLNFSGLSKENLIDEKFTDLGLFPEEDANLHIENLSLAIKKEDVHAFQCKIINKTGGYSWIESQMVPLEKEGKLTSILVIATDITERKIATDQLKSSLMEKEVLLKEIHHRVKNNMQIISSLLNLQTHHVHDDKIAVDVLKESQNRVKSMAMIHEKLYQSKDFTNIQFDDYIERLISELFYSYNIRKDRVKPSIEVEEVRLNIETAVPCGLIISELVSNCLKHAFPEGEGELNLSLKIVDDKYELIISDNGIGFPKELNFENTESLGLQLVNSLVKQIDGNIKLDKSHGTKFTIIFKELEYQDRI